MYKYIYKQVNLIFLITYFFFRNITQTISYKKKTLQTNLINFTPYLFNKKDYIYKKKLLHTLAHIEK